MTRDGEIECFFECIPSMMGKALTVVYIIPLEEMIQFYGLPLIKLRILFHESHVMIRGFFHKSRVMIRGFACGCLLHHASAVCGLQLFPLMRREVVIIQEWMWMIKRPGDFVSYYCCLVFVSVFHTSCLATLGTTVIIKIL